MAVTAARQLSTPRSARAAPASLQFFGASEDKPTVSPWFHAEDLSAPDFDAAAYVLELRQYAPLESLQEELKAYAASLKSKLVEVINEDYNDFVSLSTKLVNVDAAVLRMQRPLQEVGSKIGKVQADLREELSALETGLAKRQELATSRTLLELMQNAHHTLSKLESLLQEIEYEDDNSEVSDPSQATDRCRSLERLASEISRLNFYYTKGQDLPFIQQMRPQMEEATEKLHFRLAAAFKSALVNGEDSARQHCLLAYSHFSDMSGAEKVIRDVKIKPMVAGILDSHTTGPTRSADSFPQILKEITGRIPEVLGSLLSSTQASQSSSQGFNILGNCLLAEVDAALGDRLSGAMSPGVPDTFAVNYTATMRFLEDVETFCGSAASLNAFRGCSAYSSLMKRWRLSIYFSTRFQEIAGMLETSISSGGPLMAEEPEQHSLHLQLNPSRILLKCLERATEENVFLPSLADKFLRLLLQLLARYSTWLKIGSQPAGPEATSEQDVGQKPSWKAGAGSALLSSAKSDLDVLVQELDKFSTETVQKLVGSVSAQNGGLFTATFQTAIEDLASRSRGLVDAIVQQTAEHCASNLTQLRGITAMYRMSARPPPSRPAHYALGLLSPLQQLLELSNARYLSQSARQEIAKGVVSGLASRFQKKAGELLDTLRKTESSLNRIRHGRGADVAAGGMTDIQKISLQLFLDIKELGRQAQGYGVRVQDLSEYQELWRTVAPKEQADTIALQD